MIPQPARALRRQRAALLLAFWIVIAPTGLVLLWGWLVLVYVCAACVVLLASLVLLDRCTP